MTMVYDAIPSPIYRAFQQITHQNRIDVALSVAVKDLIRLRLKEVNAERVAFEAKYGIPFEQFNAKFQAFEVMIATAVARSPLCDVMVARESIRGSRQTRLAGWSDDFCGVPCGNPAQGRLKTRKGSM